MTLTKLVCVFVSLICVNNGARILGVVPTPSYSHQVVFQPLWRELSLRGHKVTTITTDPIYDPSLVNLTEIDLRFSYKIMNDAIPEIINASRTNPLTAVHKMRTLMFEYVENQLRHPSVQNLINDKDAKFDLVFVEYLVLTMTAFSERFQCPYIGIFLFDAPNEVHQLLGGVVHPVLYPDFLLPFSKDLSLSERLISVLYHFGMQMYVKVYMRNVENSLVEKYFGLNYPDIDTIAKNVSLVFVNSDPIFHPIKPLIPAIIQIGGGSHRTPAKPLPKDLKKILDDASSGFIYFSLGSNVKSKDIPADNQNTILSAFSELPYTVLWKFESDDLPNKPNNVFISKWLPQQDVLKHANIKLFITQGGLQSMDEAIFDHIPMLGMPYFADQAQNVKRMVENGIGLSIDYNTLEKENFKKIILELINNPKYRNKVKELAELARDQPMTGLERAVWWTEYVLRHKGAKHLRSPALDIPLYQYLLLDVIGVLLSTFAIFIFVLYVLIKSIIKFIKFCSFKCKSKVKRH